MKTDSKFTEFITFLYCIILAEASVAVENRNYNSLDPLLFAFAQISGALLRTRVTARNLSHFQL